MLNVFVLDFTVELEQKARDLKPKIYLSSFKRIRGMQNNKSRKNHYNN